MGKNLSTIRSTVRQFVRDEFEESSEQDFKDDEINLHIGEVKDEISERSPYAVKEVLTTIVNSKLLDISSIEDLVDEIDEKQDKLEYPVGNDPRDYRNLIKIDAETIEIDTTLVPVAGGSGTLTGTVTFATGSATIAGSGTSFLDDLAINYLIRPSGGTRWYRVASITSATELTLDEPVRSADTGEDTLNKTQYCYEAVYLYCRKLHQLTDELSTLTPQLERVLIDGSVAKVALSWINQVRKQVKDAGAILADVNNAIDTMSARITQAMADLTSGRPKIGKVNVGGKPQLDYAAYAARELGNANSSLSQSQGYLRESMSRLSISGVINSYQTWANNKYALYRADLGRLAQARTYTEYPKS